MTYKSILVQSEGGEECAPRLKCAANLADRFRAVLIGQGAETVLPVVFDSSYIAYDAMGVLQEAVVNDLSAAQAAFHRHCDGFGIAREWRQRQGMPADVMADAARAADLIVAGGCPRRGRNTYQTASIDDLVLTSGRPVLVAPSGKDFFTGHRVLLAWKDSRETRRAMIDALPLLRAARELVVLERCEPDGRADAEARLKDVVAALHRHDVVATTEVSISREPAETVILDHATTWGADLIVCGAYGHSRLGEWVFGGVTRALLDQDERFVLFSH